MRRDGDEDDPVDELARRRRRVSLPLADQMREMLAEVGIELDEPKPTAIPSRQTCPTVDRDAIRAILEPMGCPEWAIESCPSEDAARGFVPIKEFV